ncbi:MAG: HXXEE domain-containing protein [Bacteroidota bacterium]
MKNGPLLIGSIGILFAMLWLPLGQQDFLVEHWMKIGTYAIPFIGIGIFAFREKEVSWTSDLRAVALIMLAGYIIHQFEEHWIDIFGNTYAFYTFNNNFILTNLGQPNSATKPLTKESIFVINTSLVWLIGALAILRSPQHLFPFFAMAGIIVVNGVVHVLAGLATQAYNPGLVTSLVIFIPLYVWIVKTFRTSTPHFKVLVWGGLIWALLAHVIMVGGLLAANWFNVIPEYVYWLALILWSVLPLGMLRNLTHQQRP